MTLRSRARTRRRSPPSKESARIAAQHERARHDRESPAIATGVVLAKDRDRADQREERTGRARNWIDQRQVPGSIPSGQRGEVEGLQADGDRDEENCGPADRGLRDDQDADRERREHDRSDDVREPQERRVRSRALGEQIPRRVENRRQKNEAESKGAHR